MQSQGERAVCNSFTAATPADCLSRLRKVSSLSRRIYVRKSLRAPLLLGTTAVLFLGASRPSLCQTPPQTRKSATPPTTAAPAAPQSAHYPILLLVFGNKPSWSLRIGQKGPERLDRAGYPPIPLDPAEVTSERTTDTWTYHAKDSATGADVAVHLTRESCSDTMSAAKYTFRAVVNHAQIGTLNGCARMATELFPKITNQAASDDDDAKTKPAPTTITNFKPPITVAYINAAGGVVLKRGAVTRVVAKQGSQLAVAHDGKRLLYTGEDKGVNRAIVLYDSSTAKSSDLFQGSVQQASWSPDDTRFAFMKFVDGKWQLWISPADAPMQAALVYPGDISVIDGWVDSHTILVDDLNQLIWIGDDGKILQAIPEKDILGNAYSFSSANKFRLHPLNPDLLLVSAEWTNPPSGVPVDPHMGGGFGFFLFEIRAKRRVVLSPLNMFSQDAEWSRDGLQIFFTGSDSSRRYSTYRMFWDGTGLLKYSSGTNLVVGH